MAPQTRKMLITELSDTLLSQASDKLWWYSTTLIKITRLGNGQEDATQIGSGTYISIDGVFGILTARHVSTQLDKSSLLGIILMPGEHRYAIDYQYLKIINIGTSSVLSGDPDLSLIVLDHSHVRTINSYNKLFYHLSQKRNRVLNEPPALDLGVWFICGVPHERTSSDVSESGFIKALSFHGLCGTVGMEGEYIEGDYDYYKVKVEYSKERDVPRSFSGFSGGGLWQVLLREYDDGTIEPYEHILCGVHLGSESQGQFRLIKCHGRQSIYGKLYQEVKKQSSSLSGVIS